MNTFTVKVGRTAEVVTRCAIVGLEIDSREIQSCTCIEQAEIV